jgi:DNA-binding NarL/FixJ family response regulator
MIRVLVADDHEVVRHGIRRIVERHPDVTVVEEAASGEQVLERIDTTDADVVLLDITMPGPDFLDVMQSIRERRADLPVLVLSVHSEEHWAVRALRAGAAGFLTKEHSAEELTEAIRRVHDGRRYVTPALAERLAELVGPDGSPEAHESLSDREFQVLRALGAGRSVKQIGRDLELSHRTISTYRARILEKLDLETTADLIRYVVDHDLSD